MKLIREDDDKGKKRKGRITKVEEVVKKGQREGRKGGGKWQEKRKWRKRDKWEGRKGMKERWRKITREEAVEKKGQREGRKGVDERERIMVVHVHEGKDLCCGKGESEIGL